MKVSLWCSSVQAMTQLDTKRLGVNHVGVEVIKVERCRQAVTCHRRNGLNCLVDKEIQGKFP